MNFTRTMSLTRKVQKVTLRVFCSPLGGGGNPVTVFMSKEDPPLKSATLQKLAKGCDWESVVVHTPLRPLCTPHLSFFLPSGEEVSFCAHATMGALWAYKELKDARLSHLKFQTAMEKQTRNATVQGDTVGLFMNTSFEEQPIGETVLKEALTQHLKLKEEDFVLSSEGTGLDRPTFCNSSVARPKTLVHINSLHALHNAQAPKDANSFRELCDAIDSTGIYLYARKNGTIESVENWECRQFPRASGYPEDPATGIAAGALAVSLKKRAKKGDKIAKYDIFQGTAMGRPSLISVDEIVLRGDMLDLKCEGKIELDENDEIEVEDKDEYELAPNNISC